ncbi:hypothetical protein HK097_010443 [Rhizophlyctis rosea]|uniref:Uncharacterized protein n=1 Tax=Rhizophlyctis rosea TaxID=64517 RepID=A0AAD5X358_9FUNG|nr:hypothetical protein HK097_010443 [Rhizophlyctis rosea]
MNRLRSEIQRQDALLNLPVSKDGLRHYPAHERRSLSTSLRTLLHLFDHQANEKVIAEAYNDQLSAQLADEQQRRQRARSEIQQHQKLIQKLLDEKAALESDNEQARNELESQIAEARADVQKKEAAIREGEGVIADLQSLNKELDTALYVTGQEVGIMLKSLQRMGTAHPRVLDGVRSVLLDSGLPNLEKLSLADVPQASLSSSSVEE